MKTLEKDNYMKKSCLFCSIFICFITLALTGCGDVTESVYMEDWFTVKGYVTYTEDPFEGNQVTFDKFISSSNPPSTVSRSDYAVCYKHRFDRKPRGTIVFRQWNPETLEYEEMYGRRYSVEITANPESKTIPGIYYYLEEDDVCIVNNLYKYNLTLHTDKLTHADYAFDLKINGMRNYTFYMDKYKDYSNPFN